MVRLVRRGWPLSCLALPVVVGSALANTPGRHGQPAQCACPADDGSQILALLAYPNGSQVTIGVELTGCQRVTNGDPVRIANGHLLTELAQLAR
jgi:hypothetical protein